MGKEFLFSVVISIHNHEEYLQETIDSVLGQTIGFEEHIQLILVDNASDDASATICRSYQDKYPDNVVCIELQENTGLNGGRNAGMKAIHGRYVNFLNADDKWEKNAFAQADSLFRQYGETVDVIACRQKYFDEENRWDTLDYKFEKERRIDVIEEYRFPQYSVASCFLTQKIALAHRFNEKTDFLGGMLYINRVIFQKGAYAVSKKAVFLHRKKKTEIQDANQLKLRKIVPLEEVHSRLIKEAEGRFGYLPAFVQFTILNSIKDEFRHPLPEEFTDGERSQYLAQISDLLKHIEDSMICGMDNFWKEHKIHALSMKYGHDIRPNLLFRDGKFYYRENAIYAYAPRNFQIESIACEGNMMHFSGIADMYPLSETADLFARDMKGKCYHAVLESDGRTKQAFGTEIGTGYRFSFSIPIAQMGQFTLHVSNGKETSQVVTQDFSKKDASYLQTSEVLAIRFGNRILCIRDGNVVAS